LHHKEKIVAVIGDKAWQAAICSKYCARSTDNALRDTLKLVEEFTKLKARNLGDKDTKIHDASPVAPPAPRAFSPDRPPPGWSTRLWEPFCMQVRMLEAQCSIYVIYLGAAD